MYRKIKSKKVKALKIVAVLILVIGIIYFQIIQKNIVPVLVYEHSDYIEKRFYCYNNTTDDIISLQSKIKISHSQTRECREIATANGRLCSQEKCKIISDMEFCVNACQNGAFIDLHCDDKDDHLYALRKNLYSTVEKNCVELLN